MTRVVDGIYDDIVLDTGFFISDRDADILCDWLGSYADALEKAWLRANPDGNPRAAKHVKVRSFIMAVERMRANRPDPAAQARKAEEKKKS